MTGVDRWVTTEPDAVALAQWLLSPDRERAVVVVTTPRTDDHPFFDVETLAREVAEFAEVAVVRTGAATSALTAHLPWRCDVFDGAARVYPPTLRWAGNHAAALLRLTSSVKHARKRLAVLVEDARRAAEPEPADLLAEPPHVNLDPCPVPAVDSAADAEPWHPTPTQMHRPRQPEPIARPERTLPSRTETAPASDPRVEALTAERDAARREAAALLSVAASVEANVYRVEGQLEQARTQLRQKDETIRELRGQHKNGPDSRSLPSGPDLFADPEEAFRFDIMLAWATRLTAADKVAFPLSDYVVGPEFLPSLEAIQGIDRRKVIEIAADVVCGRAKDSTTHAPRAYRTAEDASAPQRVRDDGAAAFRVHLQNNTPAARRLHYWQLRDRRIELWNVATHDKHAR